jgi:hypothetical protein
LEKVGVDEKGTILARLRDGGVRADEAGWRFAGNFLSVDRLVGIDFVEVSKVKHLL